MKQYIDKDALVAEIKRRIILLENKSDGIISMLASGMFVNEYKDLLSFLDTLEVKEVNLDREIYSCIRNLHTVPNFEELNKFARHFFELGIKLKGE